MKRERVGEAEIRAAIRASGSAVIEEIEAGVLETDGSLSVVTSTPGIAKPPIGSQFSRKLLNCR